MKLETAVEKIGIRSGSSLSAVLSSFRYSRETHPAGSDSHGCYTLHFAKNGNGSRAKSLMPIPPTAKYRIKKHDCVSLLAVVCIWLVFFGASPASGWHDKTHLAVAKAAGYEGWYNAAGPDVAKVKCGSVEGTNHWFDNTAGVVVTPSLVLGQVELYNKASDQEGHLYGAIIASLRNYLENKEEGKYAEYHMAYCAHYIGDLSMPLHNVPYDDFNKEHHGANDGTVDADVLEHLGRISKKMYPIVIPDEAGLARDIARIANIAHRLALKLKKENRDMTREEAYTELGHSASLLKGVLTYAKEKKNVHGAAR